MIYYLIQEYDIENVVNSIYNSANFSKFDIDLFIEQIKSACGLNESITVLLKSAITLIKQSINDNNIPNKDNSFRNAKSIFLKYKPEREDKENNNSDFYSNEKVHNIIFDDIDDNNSGSKSEILNVNNNIDFDDISLRKDRAWSIESHYFRDKDGNIYKYEVGFLFRKSIIFRCFDHKCKSKAIFDLSTKKFKVITKHSLRHAEHNYISNFQKNNDSIYKEMVKKKYLDSQVYKEGKSTIIRFYS